MPGFDTQALKCVIQGTIDTAQDWSTSFFLGLNEGSSVDADTINAIATAVWAPVDTWASAAAGLVMSDVTKVTGLRVYLYEAGATHASIVGEHTPSTPVTGEGSQYLPALACLVQSLRTEFIGKSQRGRMYVPFTAGALSNAGQASDDVCSGMADATSTLFSSVNALNLTADAVTGQTVVVASFTKGATTPVTEVIVDSVVDTQHRRQDRLGALHVESHSVTLP